MLCVGATVRVFPLRVMKEGIAFKAMSTTPDTARVLVSQVDPQARTLGEAVSEAALWVANERTRVSLGYLSTLVESVYGEGASQVMSEQSHTGVDTVTTKSIVIPA